jgi:hypothetical protein
MRTFMLLGWLMVPILGIAYHQGPGQEQMRFDHVAALVRQAERHVADKEWSDAAEKYEEALKQLPAGRTEENRRLRLERAKAQMLAHNLPTAHADLKTLLEELEHDSSANPGLLADTRRALASAQYYMTWLMRLEGEPIEAWEPEIEAARQNYRLLAEQADTAGDVGAAKSFREDLEAAVRLARMDLGELQGLNLPCQCQGCKSCNSKSQCKTPSKKKGEPRDVRGASSGPPPDQSGH